MGKQQAPEIAVVRRSPGIRPSAIRVFVVEHYGASSPSSPTPRTP